MVRELTLAKHLVTNQWRELFFSKRAPGLVYMIFILAFPYALYKYWIFLQGIAERMAERKDTGELSLLFLLNLVFWLLPVSSSQQIISKLKTAKFFPLNLRSLYFVRFVTFFPVPASPFALIFSALSFYPIFYAANFLSALLYSAAVICFSIFIDFVIVNILSLRNGRPMLFGMAALITGGLMFSRLPLPETAARLNESLNSFLWTFIYVSSIFSKLLIALCLALAGGAASAFSFKLFWEQEITGRGIPVHRRAQSFRMFGDSSFFIRYGLLVRKELKDHLRSSFGPYLGALVTIYYAYFLSGSTTGGEGSDIYASFNVVLSFIFIPQVQIFYNFFGFERVPSIERYASFPIRPAGLIKIKNMAAAMLTAAALVILLPVICLKFTFVYALGFFLKWCLLAAGYIITGNVLSVYSPFNRRSSRGIPGELLFGYAGMILITSFILILIDSLRREDGINKANLLNTGALLIYALFYFISLRWNDWYLTGRWEEIRKAIAK